jgi:putative addiction module component (TIGR02574 family)
MAQLMTDDDIGKLTIPERLELIGQLWDSIPDAAPDAGIPEWHFDVVKRRLAAADANPGSGIAWEQVRDRLRSKQ